MSQIRSLLLGLGLALSATSIAWAQSSLGPVLVSDLIKQAQKQRVPASIRVRSVFDPEGCGPSVWRGVPLVTGATPGFDLRKHLPPLMKVVQEVFTGLASFNDQVLIDYPGFSKRRTLCVGFYEDGKKANAVAIEKDTILFGKNLYLQLAQAQIRDELVKVVLLHELAHSIQNIHRIDYSIPKFKALSTRRKELVADCFAGTLFSMLQTEALDMNQAVRLELLWKVLGDAHPLGDHGVACQRRLAFLYGFHQRNVNDPKNKYDLNSGPLLFGCQKYVDQPEILTPVCDRAPKLIPPKLIPPEKLWPKRKGSMR